MTDKTFKKVMKDANKSGCFHEYMNAYWRGYKQGLREGRTDGKKVGYADGEFDAKLNAYTERVRREAPSKN